MYCIAMRCSVAQYRDNCICILFVFYLHYIVVERQDVDRLTERAVHSQDNGDTNNVILSIRVSIVSI